MAGVRAYLHVCKSQHLLASVPHLLTQPLQLVFCMTTSPRFNTKKQQIDGYLSSTLVWPQITLSLTPLGPGHHFGLTPIPTGVVQDEFQGRSVTESALVSGHHEHCCTRWVAGMIPSGCTIGGACVAVRSLANRTTWPWPGTNRAFTKAQSQHRDPSFVFIEHIDLDWEVRGCLTWTPLHVM